jgi:hypothetical protein
MPARLRSERASLSNRAARRLPAMSVAFHADWSVPRPHALEQLFLRESPSRVLLDCSLHQRTTLRMPLRRFEQEAISVEGDPRERTVLGTAVADRVTPAPRGRTLRGFTRIERFWWPCLPYLTTHPALDIPHRAVGEGRRGQ